MKVTINPKKLKGSVKAIASKSYAHRILIAASLCDTPTKIYLNTTSEDIEATKNCIIALSAKVMEEKGAITVTPIDFNNTPGQCILDCNESGSTARFMLPVASVILDKFTLTGKGRLPKRPMSLLTDEMSKKGVFASSGFLPIECHGRMSGGEFEIAGDVSSQYITGLMLALPLAKGGGKIILTSPLESSAYVDITIDVLKIFGIKVIKTPDGFEIPQSKYVSPREIVVQGDWSNAAFWVVADKICNDISVLGVDYNSLQGDKKIMDILDDDVIDASQIPDLVPILAVNACAKAKKTTIKNAVRLRLKESDRIDSVTKSLTSLGADIEELPDGFIINGTGTLNGGCCDGFNDHRIVMSAAIASVICKNPVVIYGAEAINKSYPGFFEDFKALGGDIKIE